MSYPSEQPPLCQVLIVEDNDAQRQVLFDMMRAEGFEAVVCSDGAAALEAAAREDFAVAIIDLRLPDISGTRLLEHLQARHRHLRAIIHTGYGSFESAKDAVNQRAFAYVEKLGHPEELVRHVHRAAQDWMAEALLKSEEKYRQLVESVEAIVWRGDPATLRFTYVSHKAETLLGYPVARWTGEATFWQDHIHPEDRDWAVDFCRRATNEGRTHEFEYRMVAADGRVVWLRDLVNVLVEEGRPKELIGVMTNVTERKHAEMALRESEERFSKVFHASPIAIAVTRLADGRILEVNESFEHIFGYERAQLVGRSASEIGIWSDEGARERVVAQVREEGTLRDFEVWFLTVRGERCYMQGAVELFQLGEEPCLLWMGVDVTERKRLEKEILEVSTREQRRIGQDLHDELGQLLTGIGFRVAELEGDLRRAAAPNVADTAEIGQMVEQAIVQTRALARGLNPVSVEQQGLAAALLELTRSVEHIYGTRCTFTSKSPVLITDQEVASHVYRIAQESINNAVKHARATCIDVTLTQENDVITLSVRDDGSGMPPEDRRQAGMGLRIMQYRARIIGGVFSVHPGATGGTVVTCRFKQSLIHEPAVQARSHA